MATQVPTTGFSTNSPFVGQGGALVNSSGGLQNSTDGTQIRYSYCLLAQASVAAPTDFIVIQGSATRTCRIRRVKFGGVATAAANMTVYMVRRLSTGGTQGSAVLNAITAGVLDQGGTTSLLPGTAPAATAVVSYVSTANYTTVQTASGGVLVNGRAQLPAAATGVAAFTLTWDFEKSIVLRGATDYVCLNLAAQTLPAGAVFDFEMLMDEDQS